MTPSTTEPMPTEDTSGQRGDVLRIPTTGETVRRRATVEGIARGAAIGLWGLAIWKLTDHAVSVLIDLGLFDGYLEIGDTSQAVGVSGVLFGIGLVLFLLARPIARLIVRPGRPGCPGCGYEIDTTTIQCPECGLTSTEMRTGEIQRAGSWTPGVRAHRIMVMASWVRLVAAFYGLGSLTSLVQMSLMLSQFQGVVDQSWLVAPALNALVAIAAFVWAVPAARVMVPPVRQSPTPTGPQRDDRA